MLKQTNKMQQKKAFQAPQHHFSLSLIGTFCIAFTAVDMNFKLMVNNQ